jgi:alcohol dehydrogenase class IV
VSSFNELANGAAVLITALCGVVVGILARRGSKEQNRTAREIRLDTKNDNFIKNLEEDNRDLRAEMKALRERLKTPESLEDTDPTMRGA